MAKPNIADLLLSGRHPAARRRTVTESDVKHKVLSARGSSLSLDESETSVLIHLLERSENDPFHNAGPSDFLQVGDLGKIGLKAEEEEGSDHQRQRPTADALLRGANLDSNPSGELINVNQAVVAPNATPGTEEEIPASVVASLQVLQSPHEPQPVPPAGAVAPALEPEPIPTTDDSDGPIPSMEELEEPEPVTPETHAAAKDFEESRRAALATRLHEMVGAANPQAVFARNQPAVAPAAPAQPAAQPTGDHPGADGYRNMMESMRRKKQPAKQSKAPARSARRRPGNVMNEDAGGDDAAAIAAASRKAAALGAGDDDDSSGSTILIGGVPIPL